MHYKSTKFELLVVNLEERMWDMKTETMSVNVILSLGTNLGDKQKNILDAYRLIEKRVGELLKRSSFYETPAWGFESDHTFINTAIEIKTDLKPQVLLIELKAIERFLGRSISTGLGYQDRLIDIDIIDYDGIELNESFLTIPHPQMHKREFVLVPMKEIAPDYTHPVLKTNLEEYVKNSEEQGTIKRLN